MTTAIILEAFYSDFAMVKFIVIVGTRPEIIKMAPVIREIKRTKNDLFLINTGQHYDYLLSKQIIKDLELPSPNLSFKLKKSSPLLQMVEIMQKLETPLKKNQNGIVLVEGDTNSVLAAALASIKIGLRVAHVESGLRSYDWRMPEEHNRRAVDHISDILFAPTKESKKNLINEKVHGKVFVTGNTVIDAIKEHISIAQRKSSILNKIRFSDYVVVTLHRAENVDNYRIIKNIVDGLVISKVPIVMPLHPRTRKMLKKFGLFEKLRKSSHIQIILPLGYLDFLLLMKNSKYIVTDSGGIQEEVTSPQLSKKVLVLRLTTERPEALKHKISKLIPLESRKIAKAMLNEWKIPQEYFTSSPYGDGNASKKILNILKTIKFSVN